MPRAQSTTGIVDFLTALGPLAGEAFGAGIIQEERVNRAMRNIEQFIGNPGPDLPQRRETAELLLLRSIFGVPESDDQFSDLDASFP